MKLWYRWTGFFFGPRIRKAFAVRDKRPTEKNQRRAKKRDGDGMVGLFVVCDTTANTSNYCPSAFSSTSVLKQKIAIIQRGGGEGTKKERAER